MRPNNFLDLASETSLKELDKVEVNIQILDEPFKTIATVYSAQGIIDNGGLEYFFESDFPDNPSYQLFIDAYTEIGAVEEAKCIQQSLSFFDISNPELNLAARTEFLKSLPTDFSHEFQIISNRICGSEIVWTLLEKYAEQNKLIIESRSAQLH